jgi:hypothetical protein
VRAEWVDFRITEKGKEEIQSRQFEIIDRRNYLNPINEVLNFLAENPKSQVWGEGQTPKDLPCKGRHKLEATKNLVIWTVPPSQSVLDEVILRTKPKSVVVIGVLPAVINPKTFFERLGGLAKYAVKHKDGRTTLEELASACAATNDSVRIGLMLWEALGKMKVDFEENHLVISTTNGETNAAAKDIYSSLLKASLEESRAFRSYFRKGELNNYLPHAKSI